MPRKSTFDFYIRSKEARLKSILKANDGCGFASVVRRVRTFETCGSLTRSTDDASGNVSSRFEMKSC
jgi:hypothetical protein